LRRHHGATVIARRTQRASAASQENFSQRLRELAARGVADGLDVKAIAQQLGTLAEELNK
jgi:DNA-binding NarL/FixJ family response regulator